MEFSAWLGTGPLEGAMAFDGSMRPLTPGFYDRQAAATYARRYASAPNPAFAQITGNDCTNFVSQALLAGGWPMIGGSAWDSTDNGAWWYGKLQKKDYEGNVSELVDKLEVGLRLRQPTDLDERYRNSQTWSGADHFGKFLRVSHRATKVDGPDRLQPGDVMQLMNISKQEFHHTMIVIARVGGDLQYAQHSYNKTAFYRQDLLKRVSLKTDEIVHWKLRDVISPSNFPELAGAAAAGGNRRGSL